MKDFILKIELRQGRGCLSIEYVYFADQTKRHCGLNHLDKIVILERTVGSPVIKGWFNRFF